MDFFSATHHPLESTTSSGTTTTDNFADAIANRFFANSASFSHFNHMPLIPDVVKTNSSSLLTFTPLTPDSLQAWLDDPATLVVDIRPHAAYSVARLPRAVSLSVPSTLLKRPLFSLQRLSEMLPSPAARVRFSAWRTAARIVVYDADANAIPDSSNIHGLLRKFKSDGYSGELAWLQGGFQAVWRERKHLVDTHPPTPEIDDDDELDDHERPTPTAFNNILRTRHLPMAAFSLSSTTVHNSPHFNPTAAAGAAATAPINHDHSNTHSHPAFNPFFDTIRQNVELSHGITERITLRLPRRVRRRINDLPFLWLQQIARRAAPFPSHNRSLTDSSSEDESEDDDTPDPADVEEGADALAMQFYRIELAEQRRLQGIMEHHSKESGTLAEHPHGSHITFPFSITAGVEKGAKNRYRHIWPFEHARVRLHQKHEADDDYVNASYIQPLGTSRRYIATQGPLPATFVDFWTLCWEQNVHVIVMLTREVEGSMIKCGSYWTDSTFGPLRLRLVSTSGPPDETPTGGFFAPRLSVHSPRISRHETTTPHRPHNSKPETIKRVFDLTHTGYPDAKPRRIVHLQYLGWPDMNVPEDPRGVLGLIKEVDAAVRDTAVKDEAAVPRKSREAGDLSVEMDERTGVAKHALGANSPVLLHCSAGVGRTGGFIAVDSILHAIRRDIRKTNQAEPMDVDKTEALSNEPHKMTPVNEARMQVDAEGPDTSESEHEKPLLDPTTKWVRTQDSTRSPSNVARPSIVPFPSGSSGSEESLLGLESIGSYNPSSSLGTTVSGASSPIKAFFPPSSVNTPDTSLSGSLVPSKRAGHDQMSLKLPPRRPYASLPSAIQASSPLTAPWLPSDRQVKSPLPSTKPTDPSPLRLSIRDPMLVSIASDNEPPSRSVSPSVDHASPSHAFSLPLPQAGISHTTPHTANSLPPMSRVPPKPSLRLPPVKSFDYKEPRALHEDFSPLSIASFDDPIWEVIQDMREQRMSLCQSLRQYVFVHAAVIEGALMVLDDENDAVDEGHAMVRFGSRNVPARFSAMSTPMPRRGDEGGAKAAGASPRMYLSDASSAASVGKRGASPTELLNVDRQGLVMKRPSVKRKHRSGDDVSRGAPFQRVQAKMAPSSSSPPR